MGVGGSVDWGVDICVGYEVGSADGITFGLDYGYGLVYYYGFFDGFNYCKAVDSLIEESLENNNGTLPDLSEIDRGVNDGVRSSVFICIGRGVGGGVVGGIEIGDDGLVW